MNFPEVPFSENLFESNEAMKDYWKRSTEDRPFIAEQSKFEEPEDIEELRYISMNSWSKPPEDSVVFYDEIRQIPVWPNMRTDISAVANAEVKPKSDSTTNSFAWIIVLIFVFVLLIHYSSNYVSSTQQKAFRQ